MDASDICWEELAGEFEGEYGEGKKKDMGTANTILTHSVLLLLSDQNFSRFHFHI